MKKTILTLSFLLLTNMGSFAQAYDGFGDNKIFVGTNYMQEGIGLTFMYDIGISDYISYGYVLGYSFQPKSGMIQVDYDQNNDGVVDENDLEKTTYNITERIYTTLILNGHFGEVLNFGENIDLYGGINFGKNFGSQLGFRYMFGENLGLNAEVNLPIIPNVYTKIVDEGGNENQLCNFERVFINFGLVFNL